MNFDESAIDGNSWEGEAPVVPTWEGEAPAEPTTAAETNGSAGASPSQ